MSFFLGRSCRCCGALKSFFFFSGQRLPLTYLLPATLPIHTNWAHTCLASVIHYRLCIPCYVLLHLNTCHSIPHFSWGLHTQLKHKQSKSMLRPSQWAHSGERTSANSSYETASGDRGSRQTLGIISLRGLWATSQGWSDSGVVWLQNALITV